MFALALYDRTRQCLILARDPLGIKPLYYALTDAAWCSPRDCARWRRAGWSGGRSTGGRWRDRWPMARFPAAHPVSPRALAGTWNLDNRGFDPTSQRLIAAARAALLAFSPAATRERLPETLATLRALLSESVRAHLLSDVPLGFFLSSGLDSSALAVLSAAVAPEAVQTLTVGFADHRALDENPVAAETARLLGLNHHLIELTEAEVLAQTRRYLAALDQPTLDGLNTFIIAGAVRARGIKVALSGLGGDEVRRLSLFSSGAGPGPLLSRLAWSPPRCAARQPASALSGKPGRNARKPANWRSRRPRCAICIFVVAGCVPIRNSRLSAWGRRI